MKIEKEGGGMCEEGERGEREKQRSGNREGVEEKE